MSNATTATLLPAANPAADPAADSAAAPAEDYAATLPTSTHFYLPSDQSANEVLYVFVGVGLLWLFCIALSVTVVASTLREMRYWVLRTSRAERVERELSEATGLPGCNGAFRPNERFDDEDYEADDCENATDPPLLAPATKKRELNYANVHGHHTRRAASTSIVVAGYKGGGGGAGGNGGP